jgi:hypothetical protein
MALVPTVLTDAFLLINANNLSDHAQKVGCNFTFEDLDATTFGQTAHVRRAGLQDGSLDVSWLNDFQAANLDAIMWPLAGGAPVSFEVRATSAARSATNPAYIGNIVILQWKPISGDVGKLVTVDVSFPTSGLSTRVVA